MAEEEVGRLEMEVGEASADFADGADFEISDFGFAICDWGKVAAAGVDKKPIFKAVCAAGEICDKVGGDGFNFSGKFGNVGAESSAVDFSLGELCVFVVENCFGFSGSA